MREYIEILIQNYATSSINAKTEMEIMKRNNQEYLEGYYRGKSDALGNVARELRKMLEENKSEVTQ